MAAGLHLRGIVIAGALAALALALGFMTLTMNKTASVAAPHTVLPLKLRHRHTVAVKPQAHSRTTAKHSKRTATAAHVKSVVAHKKPTPKRVNRNFSAAVKAGLPPSIARALAAHRVAVVEVTSRADSIAELSAGEAKAGATLAGASYVAVNVDRDGGDVEVLTRLLGELPVAPATLVYVRPATLAATLPGFNDRTVVQQAASSAAGRTPAQ